MYIKKIFNNNVVLTILDNNTEAIITGAGVGFKKKPGDFIDENLISKSYIIQDNQRYRYNQILNDTSIEYFRISEEIIEKANDMLENYVDDSIIISLTSHIKFAVEREQQGIKLPNLILNETKYLYKEEFKIGLWAIDHIYNVIGIKLPVDEAGYIAIHIINGLVNTKENEGISILEFSKEVVDIIENIYECKLDQESMGYMRLMTHLKFFVQRILKKESYEDSRMDSMYKIINKRFINSKKCIDEISKLVLEKFEYDISSSEELYLMIHINKITTNEF
ncbi:PRD domain-containing protein [Terrisporobacter mayombei]|uniref:Transcription antiterminator LicT n=1 Tax=Terrisporobacter mayombei TaxID=1541 RepID=A0ABY9Q6B3_9FIRM|nr:PRD domain-containing protein [Terrisporobacter mayombei]MCC3868802.1 PRD domain-containing protein [Terrisporobacter mayombei]WMT83068.1 Transcription antiterminator LicT [Terrisporobacter mayombei]